MKRILLVTVLSLSLVLCSNAQSIKKLSIEDVLKIADTSSVPLVINFWASWCRPCVQELPWFENLVPNYKDKQVKLLLVSLDYADDYPKEIMLFAKKKGIKSEIAWLNETDPNIFCHKVDKHWDGTIPVTLMVNKKKNYRKFYNHQLPEAQLKQALDKLID